MKVLDRKKIIVILSVIFIVILVFAMVLVRQAKGNPYGDEATSVVNEKEVTEVGDALRAAELSNVDLFETWVYEYIESKDKNYQSNAYSDTDSMMTAMLLLDDQISCENAQEYKGNYLKEDVSRIEKENMYIFIRDNLSVFTTLFGETKIPGGGIRESLPENWKAHGIKVFNDKASLVSLVVKPDDKEETVVGHAAVLIDCSKLDDDNYKGYLLVEKRGLNDAFMATEMEDPKDMIGLFSQREEYKEMAGKEKPLLYVNDELIGELK